MKKLILAAVVLTLPIACTTDAPRQVSAGEQKALAAEGKKILSEKAV